MTSRWIPRPISATEADIVRATLQRAPAEHDRTSLVPTIDSLVVVDRCKCGCASVDFAVGGGSGTILADALGKTRADADVGIIVWGNDERISSLEIYDFEPGSNSELPLAESIVPWGADRPHA